MPDKYSYKQSKKKKPVKRTAASPATVSGQAIPAKEAPMVAGLSPTGAIRTTIVTPAAAALARTESRAGARVSNLGAELRRVALLGGVIVVVLVVAALALT